MSTTAAKRELAIFQMTGAIAFLAITMPLGLIYDLQSVAGEGSASYTDFKFAWPIYVSALIGAIWALIAAGTWIVAYEEPVKDPGADWYAE
jgi:hypothetical protein